jgi:hypothetical protein
MDLVSTTCTFRQCSLRYFLEGKHRLDPDLELATVQLGQTLKKVQHTTPDDSVSGLSSAVVAYPRFELRSERF